MSTFPMNPADPSTTLSNLREQEDLIIERALAILNARLFSRGPAINNSSDVRNFLQTKLMPEDREIFAVLFLDSGFRVLAYEVLSRGSLTRASVYPREVIQRSLTHNAAALVIAHNNPSGRAEPSAADRDLTRSLKELLSQLDIQLLDHLVIGEGKPFSFAAHGLI
jgi:DNA repair protein RadC